MSPDLAAPLIAAILGDSSITAMLPDYENTFPVFSRRPAPVDTPRPVIFVSPDIAQSETDGVNDRRPTFTRDISIYGYNATAQQYRDIETISYLVHDLFHRQRGGITIPSWNVVLILATGPIVAPVDDDNVVGRIVTLTIQLAKLGV